MQDQEILDALRRTPEQGMQALMEQHAGLIYAVVKDKLRGDMFCASDVESCVADAFSEFYLDLDKYIPEKGSIRSWLCVIAKHNALDLLRRRYRESQVLSLEEAITEADDEVLIESDLEERELRKVVLRAVNELGEPDREIVLRKFYLGESSREIATRLELSVSNVDTRTHRAMGKLRKKLKEWG